MKSNLVLLLPLVALLGGCKREVVEYSEVLTEPATVVDLVYTPSRHGSGVGPSFDLTGDGGIGFAVTDVSIPERYAVIFRCAHGKFIVQNDQNLVRRLWNELTEGQRVTVSYREQYSATYEDKELLSRRLTKYHFIDAK